MRLHPPYQHHWILATSILHDHCGWYVQYEITVNVLGLLLQQTNYSSCWSITRPTMTNSYCQLHHRCACFSITGDVRIGEKLDRRMNTAGTSAKKLPEMCGMEGLCIQNNAQSYRHDSNYDSHLIPGLKPTSLLLCSVSGGWVAGALLMAISDSFPPLVIQVLLLERTDYHRALDDKYIRRDCQLRTSQVCMF